MILSIILIILVVILDQVTKILSLEYLAGIDTFPLIRNVLHLTYVENKGAAFGMLADHRWVFMVISVIGIAALFMWIVISKPENKFMICGLSFVIGGGIGNMIDRCFRGFVVDMIDCRFIDFYVFNVADSFVCIGCGIVLLVLICEIFAEAKEKKASQAQKQ